MRLPLAVLAVGLFLPVQAQARDCTWQTRSYACVGTITGHVTTCYRNVCVYPRTYYSRDYGYRDRDYERSRRHYSHPSGRDVEVARHRDDGPPPPRRKCREIMEGKGDRTLTRAGGIRVAERRWQAAVLNAWGERYMDIQFAQDYRWQCHRASTNESIFGKGAESIAGRFSYRCTIWAQPCEAPVYAGRPDKDALEKTKAQTASDEDEDGAEETRAPRRP